jgi:hypothetical protein
MSPKDEALDWLADAQVANLCPKSNRYSQHMILELTHEQAYILLTLVQNQIEFLEEYKDPKLFSIEIREYEQCKQLFDKLTVICG